MLRRLIIFSGTIGSGKSTVARELVERCGISRLSTRELIKERFPEIGDDRRLLQQAGATLDKESDGRWVADEMGRWLSRVTDEALVVLLDAVRQPSQISALRRQFSQVALHVHFDAELLVRRKRYETRSRPGDEKLSFDEAIADPIEANVPRLADVADCVIDTTHATAEDVVARIGGIARLWGNPHERLVDVVVGGQWGSEGKGQIAAHLAPEYDILIRVGGPNAGHSVFADPAPLKFHHLPSGWGRNRVCQLVLGPGAVIYPQELLREVMLHEVPQTQLRIDPLAMVIVDRDREAEALLEAAIGSTRRGVGAATARKVMRVEGQVPNWSAVQLAKDNLDLKPYIFPSLEILEEAYRKRQRLLVEGTQGTSLSLHHGSFPYVTSRDTTIAGCLSEAGIAPTRVRRIVMTCRTYPIRVQSPNDESSGPMGREIDWDVIAHRSGIPEGELRKHEQTTTTHKPRRVAEFNWEGVRRAAVLNGPTDIALTFVDYLGIENRNASRFNQLSPNAREFVEAVEQMTGSPVSLIAKDFSHSPIIDRRQW